MKRLRFFELLRNLGLLRPTGRSNAGGVASRREPRGGARPQRVAHVYQIYYSEETKRMLDSGFLPLDNTDSPQPEWREYFPIRKYLLTQLLEENRHYGFLAPRFFAKTHLDSNAVYSFIERNKDADVIFFSPYCDQQALFLNSFTQGEFYVPGLMRAAEQFFERIGIDVNLRRYVMDSRSMVFCNYFVAKPAFWRAWLAINEKLYELSEPSGDLCSVLNKCTDYYGNQIPAKVFIMERIVSLLLATDTSWSAKGYNPFEISISTQFPEHLNTAIVCDALKIAYRTQGRDAYMARYMEMLNEHSIPQPHNAPG
jgi:hypothetical protein